jgi:hypothetical protein
LSLGRDRCDRINRKIRSRPTRPRATTSAGAQAQPMEAFFLASSPLHSSALVSLTRHPPRRPSAAPPSLVTLHAALAPRRPHAAPPSLVSLVILCAALAPRRTTQPRRPPARHHTASPTPTLRDGRWEPAAAGTAAIPPPRASPSVLAGSCRRRGHTTSPPAPHPRRVTVGGIFNLGHR